MESLVHQLGELFLGAAPTVLIIVVFYLIFRSIFFKPLLAVMAEREARTEGAQKAAMAALSGAAERVKQYQDSLKQARAQVYAEQEAARQVQLQERARLIKEARSKAAMEVEAAKNRIAAELASASREIEATVKPLSAEIARRLLQTQAGPSSPTRVA
jgi:F-type H+-transporting ATPase subunit b